MKILLACFVAVLFAGCAALPTHYEALDEHVLLGIEDTLKRIGHERVIFVGEDHTDMSDHLFQLRLIRYLHEHGRRTGIAFEVFSREQQQVLNDWVTGAVDKPAFVRQCDMIWADLFTYYGDILSYARSAGIPLFGLNAPKGYITSFARQGPGIAPALRLQEMGFSGCEGIPEYKDLMASVEGRGVHRERLPFFCDAQLFSDTIMAGNIAEILTMNQDITLVVIAGAAHASKIAIPRILKQGQPVSFRVLLPASFRDMLQRDVTSEFADYIWY